MKTEKIIAEIEEYVKSLDTAEQDFFFKCSNDLTAKKGSLPLINLAVLVRDLKQELKQECAKSEKGASFASRQKLLQKLILKNPDRMSQYQKGVYADIKMERMQTFIINGHYAMAFHADSIFDIETVENQKEWLDLNTVFPKDTDSYNQVNYDISNIKALAKLIKSKKQKYPVRIGDAWYNAEYFLNVVKILGGNVKMMQSNNPLLPAYFESENGIAILLPVNITAFREIPEYLQVNNVMPD